MITHSTSQELQERVGGHFQERWVALRQKSVGREAAVAEYGRSAEVREVLEELFRKAQKAIEMFEGYKSLLWLRLEDDRHPITFEKFFNHKGFIREFFYQSPKPRPAAQVSEDLPFEVPPKYTKAVGVVIVLPRSRFVMTEPAGHHEGFRYTFPKGTPKSSESLEQAAVRIAKEQTGLEVAIERLIADFPCGMRLVRLFQAVCVGGDPAECGWKSERVHFVFCQRQHYFLMQNEQKGFMSLSSRMQYPGVDKATTFYSSQNGFHFFREELSRSWLLLETGKPQKSQQVALQNRSLNRTRDNQTLPFDDTRVRLSSDLYIAASTIKLEGVKKSFIAAEGPLDRTVGNFWTMAFEHTPEGDTGIIVMLTALIDMGLYMRCRKCAKYWPELGEEIESQGIRVKTVRERELRPGSGIWLREFEIQRQDGKRTIQQLHHEKWPDCGVVSAEELRYLVTTTLALGQQETTPLIVHCSQGIGRTGCFILAYALMVGEIRDPVSIIHSMRQQRPLMVPGEEQAHLAIEAAYCGNPS